MRAYVERGRNTQPGWGSGDGRTYTLRGIGETRLRTHLSRQAVPNSKEGPNPGIARGVTLKKKDRKIFRSLAVSLTSLMQQAGRPTDRPTENLTLRSYEVGDRFDGVRVYTVLRCHTKENSSFLKVSLFKALVGRFVGRSRQSRVQRLFYVGLASPELWENLLWRIMGQS